MANIIEAIVGVFAPSDNGHSELPMYDDDEIVLLSDTYNNGYHIDDEAIEELEKDIALSAYAEAQKNTFRPNNEVYRCDFYKGITKRILVHAVEKDIKWRLDEDHAVAKYLYMLRGVEPFHVCRDYFGDQYIYETDQIESAIDSVIALCEKYGYAVLDDPAEKEEINE